MTINATKTRGRVPLQGRSHVAARRGATGLAPRFRRSARFVDHAARIILKTWCNCEIICQDCRTLVYSGVVGSRSPFGRPLGSPVQPVKNHTTRQNVASRPNDT